MFYIHRLPAEIHEWSNCERRAKVRSGTIQNSFGQTCWIYWYFFVYREYNWQRSCFYYAEFLLLMFRCPKTSDLDQSALYPSKVCHQRSVFTFLFWGGEILGPSLLQNYLQMWVEGCVTESCAIRFMNGSPSLRKCAGICVIRMYVCVIRLCETDGLTCMCNVNM